jgi:hypothetical protein
VVTVKEKGSKGRDVSSCGQSKSKSQGCWQEERCRTDNGVHVTNDGSHASETDGYDINSSQNKTKAKFPSGLVPNWQLKLSAPSQSSLKMKPKVSEPEDIALGGLDNKDAFTTFSPVKLKGTGHNCTNNVSYQ